MRLEQDFVMIRSSLRSIAIGFLSKLLSSSDDVDDGDDEGGVTVDWLLLTVDDEKCCRERELQGGEDLVGERKEL